MWFLVASKYYCFFLVIISFSDNHISYKSWKNGIHDLLLSTTTSNTKALQNAVSLQTTYTLEAD